MSKETLAFWGRKRVVHRWMRRMARMDKGEREAVRQELQQEWAGVFGKMLRREEMYVALAKAGFSRN